MSRSVRVALFLALGLLISGSLARADGLLSESDRKNAIECQKALLSATAKLFSKQLAILAKCNDKALDCVHEPKEAARTKCLGAGNPCRTALQGVLAKAGSDLEGSIAKKCGSLDQEDQLLGPKGLGFELVDPECLAIGSALDNVSDVAACLQKVFRRSIERLFAIESPRAREIFNATKINVGGLPDLPAYPSCGDRCSVTGTDPKEVTKSANQLTKCGKSITSAGRLYAATATKLLSKCALSLFKCEQSPKPLSDGDIEICRGKARNACGNATTKAQAAQEKVRTKVRTACAQTPDDLLTSPQGLNVSTLACECSAVNKEVTNLDQYLACSQLHHECRVAQLLRFAIPRLDELLLSGIGTRLERILCDIPPDESVTTATRAGPPGCRICRFVSAIRGRFNRPLLGPINKFAAYTRGVSKSRTGNVTRQAEARTGTRPTITKIDGDETYAPNRSRQITVGYDLGSLATASLRTGEKPKMLIAVERLDGSLVANDAFELELEPSVGETELTVAYSPAVPGESGCSFRLVFGIANGDDTEFLPFDLGASTCQINKIEEPGEDCDDGNDINGDECDNNCTITRCGNGIVTGDEVCDDGNLDAGDACPLLDCGVPTSALTPTPTTLTASPTSIPPTSVTVTASPTPIPPTPTARSLLTRVSVRSDGGESLGASSHPVLSADGRFVAFMSDASNLVANDTNGENDIFVHDRQTGITTRVSVDSAGMQGNDFSALPGISADGRFVGFWGRATNLVPGDTNARGDVFLHDRQTGVTTRVSVASAGTQAIGGESVGQPALSADGSLIAFESYATNLVPGGTNGDYHVFVRDRPAGTTTMVSVNSIGEQGDNWSTNPAISADGRFVAFASIATNLVANDTNGEGDIFVRDRWSNVTTRVSVDSGGIQGNGWSYSTLALSADGRFVVFESRATNLVPGDTNNATDVFVHDRQTSITTRVSVDSVGMAGNGESWFPALSANGRFVAFRSTSRLVSDDTNDGFDTFVRDLQNGITMRVNVDLAGMQAMSDGNALLGDDHPALSSDGRFVAFPSYAPNLVAGDTNGFADIFVRDLVQ